MIFALKYLIDSCLLFNIKDKLDNNLLTIKKVTGHKMMKNTWDRVNIARIKVWNNTRSVIYFDLVCLLSELDCPHCPKYRPAHTNPLFFFIPEINFLQFLSPMCSSSYRSSLKNNINSFEISKLIPRRCHIYSDKFQRFALDTSKMTTYNISFPPIAHPFQSKNINKISKS